jgi:hypothetical protein
MNERGFMAEENKLEQPIEAKKELEFRLADDADSQARYAMARARWDARLEPLRDANLAAERLGKEDFEIRINTTE